MNGVATPGPGKKQIMGLYILFGAGLLLSVVPTISAAFFSMVLILGVLIAAYVLRAGKAQDSLMRNHMTYVISTIWAGSFLAALTVIAAGLYLFYALDNAPLQPCIEAFLHMGVGPGQEMLMLDPESLFHAFQGCYDDYITKNFMIFAIGTVIAAGPVLLYFIIRYVRGLAGLLKNRNIPKPERWFK